MKFNKGAKPMRKVVALLTIVLLLSLVGCSGSVAVNDVPSSEIESQSPSEIPETPPEETPSTQAPAQSEEPEETTQAPLESEDLPEETIAPTVEPTSAPSPSSSPAHTHSYTSTITKQATCVDGIRTYNCSCGDSYTEVIKATGNHNYSSTVTKQATCAEEGVKTYTCSTCGNKYNETIGKTNDHKWETVHIDEWGRYESSGTHRVLFKRCHCGFEVNSDMPNWYETWENHSLKCLSANSEWYEEVPNGDAKYVVIVPAHDEVYCSICGIAQ